MKRDPFKLCKVAAALAACMVSFMKPTAAHSPGVVPSDSPPERSSSVRSTPPDNRNRYSRPAIPEDRVNTPVNSDAKPVDPKAR